MAPHPTINSHRIRLCRRHGAALILVMIAVTIAAILGLTFLSISSTSRAATFTIADSSQARSVAESGLAIALAVIENDNTWRTGRSEGTWLSNIPFANGSFTINIYDGIDADGDGTIDGDHDLTNNSSDPVTIQSIGTVNGISVMTSSFHVFPTSNSALVVSLDSSNSTTVEVTGNARLIVPSLSVNSNSSTAIKVTGSSVIQSPTITVVGDAKFTGSSYYTGTLTTGTAGTTDPYASLPVPTTGADLGKVQVSSGKSGSAEPGYYSDGIKVSGSGTLTLQPGVYVLGGKGLEVSGSTTLIGTGVTIYLEENAGITLGGNTTIQLSASESGTYNGILFFQARDNDAEAKISTSGNVSLAGTMYIPAGTVNVSGSAKLNLSDALVASRIKVSGSGIIEIGGSN